MKLWYMTGVEPIIIENKYNLPSSLRSLDVTGNNNKINVSPGTGVPYPKLQKLVDTHLDTDFYIRL